MKSSSTLLCLFLCVSHWVYSQSEYRLLSSSQITSPASRGGMTDSEGNHLNVFVEQAGFPSDWDICLTKLSGADLTVTWSKRYRLVNTSEDVRSFTEDPEHYYIVGFSQLGTNADGLILKVRKSDGALMLAKKFNGAVADDRDELAGSMVKGQRLIVCGHTRNPSFTSTLSNKGDAILLELSLATLDTVRTLRVGAYDRFDNFTHLLEASNGDLLVAGTKVPFIITNPSSTTNDYFDLTLFRLDPAWNILWKKTYNNYALSNTESLANGSSGLVEGPSGDIYLTFDPGWSSLQRGIFRIGQNGNFLQGIKLPTGTRPLGITFAGGAPLIHGLSGSKAMLSSMNQSSLSPTWSRRYNFGAGTSILWNIDIAPGKMLGFGSASSNSKLMFFQGNNTGDLGACGTEALSVTSTPYTPDTTRTFTHLLGHFPFQGITVSVSEINLAMTVTPCASTVLPVELLTFRGECTGNSKADLYWETASEQNSDSFVIEKSEDGLTFSSIGVVEAAGTSQTNTAYEHTDNQVRAGITYYRLRMVDLDGTTELSPTIAVKQLEGALSYPYPNPCSTGALVTIYGRSQAVSIGTPDGKLLWQRSGTKSFEAPHASGMYIVGFEDGTNSILVVN